MPRLLQCSSGHQWQRSSADPHDTVTDEDLVCPVCGSRQVTSVKERDTSPGTNQGTMIDENVPTALPAAVREATAALEGGPGSTFPNIHDRTVALPDPSSAGAEMTDQTVALEGMPAAQPDDQRPDTIMPLGRSPGKGTPTQAGISDKLVDEWGDTIHGVAPPMGPRPATQGATPSKQVDEWGDTIHGVVPRPPTQEATPSKQVDEWGDTIRGALADTPAKQRDEWGDAIHGAAPPPSVRPDAGAAPSSKQMDEWGDTIRPGSAPAAELSQTAARGDKAVDEWGDTIQPGAGISSEGSVSTPSTARKRTDEWGDTLPPSDDPARTGELAASKRQAALPQAGVGEPTAVRPDSAQPGGSAAPAAPSERTVALPSDSQPGGLAARAAPPPSERTVALTDPSHPPVSAPQAGTIAWPASGAGAAGAAQAPSAGTVEYGTQATGKQPPTGRDRTSPVAPSGGEMPFAISEPGESAETTRIAGYEILGELGRGGMGVVYKAKQLGLNRIVALKMILAAGQVTQKDLARFRIEGEAVAQLQHPNIVQIYEVGEHEGAPYFSLEYIDGGSLQGKISKDPPPARESAQIMLALAEGMDCAHRKGIIHRDLKPANVLLARDGTPKITDFGLAKKLDEDSGQTRAGTVLGTPSYMPPEQAEGKVDQLGTHSDIYSLGAILYDLVTGRPPFRGETLLDTLYLVKSADPVPPQRLQPKLPRDLETICLKCLEKDPVKRYSTAGDLAADLRRFLNDEPIVARPVSRTERTIKWMRRNRMATAAIALGALFILSLAFGGTAYGVMERNRAEMEAALRGEAVAAQQRAEEQEKIAKEQERIAKEQEGIAKKERDNALTQERIAKEQRDRAEMNFQSAREAVDTMLTKVGQVNLAHVPQMEPIRKALLNDAMKFYGRFMTQKSKDPAVRSEMARAHFRVGAIQELLAKSHEEHQAAEASYHQAVAMFRQLEQEFPQEPLYPKELAATYTNLGALLNKEGRNDEAEKVYREALAIQQRLAKAQPAVADYPLEEAKTANNLGVLLMNRGRLQDAEPLFRQAGALHQQLAKRHPKDPVYRQELARDQNNLGELLKNMGKLQDAEAAFGQAQATLTKLAAEDAANADYKRELATSHQHLADLLRDIKPKEAEAAYGQALKLYERLVRDFPSSPIYQQELAATYANLAILLQAANRQEEADKAYNKAVTLRSELVQKFPDVPDYRAEEARSLRNRGFLQQTRQQLKEAETSYRQALKVFGDLTNDFPDRPEYRQEQGRLLASFVALQQQLGNAKDSVKSCIEAANIFNELVTDFPEVPDYQLELAQTYMNLAILRYGANQLEDAEKTAGQAADVFARMAKKWPVLPALSRQEGAKIYHLLGILANANKKPKEAAAAYGHANALRQELVKEAPQDVSYREALASSLGDLAVLQAGNNQADQAVENFRLAVTALEGAAPPVESAPAYWQALANHSRNVSNMLAAMGGKAAEAEESLKKAVAAQQKLTAAFPQALDHKVNLAAMLRDLAVTSLDRNKEADARAFLREAIRQQQKVAAGDPQQAAYRQGLLKYYLELAQIELHLQDHAAGARALADLAKVPLVDPVVYFPMAAALLAQSVNLAQKDTKLADAQRTELVENYGSQAVDFLRKAMMGGYKDYAVLENDRGFDPLRARADFKKLLGTRVREKTLRRVVPLKEKLVADYPQEARYRTDLARALRELADVLLLNAKPTEASRFLQEAVKHEEAALKMAPQ